MSDVFYDLCLFNIKAAAIAGEYAGMYSHALLILLMGAPTALLDKTVSCVTKDCSSSDREEYTLSAPSLFYPCSRKVSVYRGGFFTKYPVGAIAEKGGLVLNAAVSATTFLAVATTGFALMAAAGAVALGLVLAYAALALVAACIGSIFPKTQVLVIKA